VRVTVIYSPAPRQVLEWPLDLPAGATARQAVLASGLPDVFPAYEAEAAAPGIWGRKVSWDQPLRDRDRVEVYRELKVDPKLARRQRFRKQGARGAGLFAKRRPGGKAGY
jgi:putative ubiquitin-RnfH superfamily antitoxin RatB of RatAB toxin-antitoxin module